MSFRAGVAILAGVVIVGWCIYLRYAWMYRHMARTAEIDALIAATVPIVEALEEHRRKHGTYPELLVEVADSPTIETSELLYRRLSGGNDYELMQAHSHWVGSFNALVYSPDGLYRSLWDELHFKEHRSWRYAVGAQTVYGDL